MTENDRIQKGLNHLYEETKDESYLLMAQSMRLGGMTAKEASRYATSQFFKDVIRYTEIAIMAGEEVRPMLEQLTRTIFEATSAMAIKASKETKNE